MGLESGTYVSDLNKLWPLDSDLESQGAAHLRLIKSCLQSTFPGTGPGSVPVWMGVSPPSSPQNGALWWDTNGGQLYVWYQDGTSNQWVLASNVFQPSIQGVTDGSNAAAGMIGEFLTATQSQTLLNGAGQGITSVGLSAGDWDVSGQVTLNNTPTTCTFFAGGISTTFAQAPSQPNAAGIDIPIGGAVFGVNTMIALPVSRFNITAGQTVYVNAQANFTGTSPTCTGTIRARRVR